MEKHQKLPDFSDKDIDVALLGLEKPDLPTPDKASGPLPDFSDEDIDEAFDALQTPEAPISIQPESMSRRLSKAEVERRSRLIIAVDRSHELDENFVHSVWKGPEDLHDRILAIQKLATLSYGEQTESVSLGDGSANSVHRCVYEGDPDVTAYVKAQSGEGAWKYDEQTKIVSQISRTIDEKTGDIDVHEKPFLTEEQAQNFLNVYRSKDSTAEEKSNAIYKYGIWKAFSEKAKQLQVTKESVAMAYGIKPEEVPLSGELTPRNGIEAGSMPLREYAVSRIDLLFNLNVVPLTVLRKNETGSDMSSAQEEVTSKVKNIPARNFLLGDLHEFKRLGKEHPGATSMMRIAALHYIVKAVDCHNENLFIDPVTKQCMSIDNGFCLGLSTAEKDENGKVIRKELDQFRSLPMEIIEEHDDWKLDEEALDELKRVYGSIVSYLALRATGEHRPSLRTSEEGGLEVQAPASEGKEIKYMTDLFRLLYGNEKIASIEAQSMLVRLGEIIENGRPPVKKLVEKKQLLRVAGFM